MRNFSRVGVILSKFWVRVLRWRAVTVLLYGAGSGKLRPAEIGIEQN